MTAYVFVLGTGRCGSTLVHEVLCRHPGVGFITNVEDNLRGADPTARFAGRLFRRLPPAASQKGRLRYAPSEGYRALHRLVSPMLTEPCRDLLAADATPWLARRTRSFFAARAAAAGAPVFSHKFTGWPRSGFLAAALPEARFLHVVRDGRAVANSFLQMDWWSGWAGPARWSWGPLAPAYDEAWRASGRSFVALAGLNWRLLLDAFDAARALVPAARWLELSYEDVIAEPAERLAQVLEFAGLPRSADFDAGLARYRFTTGRSDAFRRDLSPADVALLDEVLAEPLARYGYR